MKKLLELQTYRRILQTFKSLKGKLDHRLGYCIIGCLFTITTVLIIFGLFHEIAYEALTEYIGSTRKLIVDSIPSSTVSPIVTTTTTIDWSNISLDKDEIIFHVDNERLDGKFVGNLKIFAVIFKYCFTIINYITTEKIASKIKKIDEMN